MTVSTHRLRVARPVADYHPCRVVLHDVRVGGVERHPHYRVPSPEHVPDDALLHAAVDQARPSSRRPRRSSAPSPRPASQSPPSRSGRPSRGASSAPSCWRAPCPFDKAHIITPRSLIVETSARVSTPSIPGMPWSDIQLERFCTDAQWLGLWQCSCTTNPETFIPLRLEISGEPEDVLLLTARDAVVADERVREAEHLTRVRGVGHRLWIADHPRVEDYLADDGGLCAKTLPEEECAVL